MSLSLEIFSTLILSVGLCIAISLPAFILSVPEPLISVGIAANRQAYVGNDVTMECIIRLDPAIQPTEVSVDVRWLKNGERYNEQSVTSHDMMSSTIFFDYLLESHGGEYTCEATLTHVNSSPRITSKDFNLPAIGNQSSLTHEPQTMYFLCSAIIDSNNLTFLATCSGHASLQSVCTVVHSLGRG